MKKVLSFFLTVALLACFGLSTAAAKSAQPNATTLRLFAPTPDPDRDTLAVTDVSYTLNYKQSALPLQMVRKPVLVLADGTIKIETDFTAIEYSLTSAAGPWSDAVANPDPIPYGSGTANIYWRVKYNGEWYATKDGKAHKVTMNYPPCEASLFPTDGDGNIYEVVRVAGNCWTKTNLKAKKYAVDVKDYSAGDSVRNVIIYSADGNSDTASNKDKYGCLYSWFSAVGLAEGSTESPRTNEWGNVEGVCPAGWNLPNAADYRAMLGIEANRLRSYNNWIANPGRNTTGMSMQPGGYYDSGSDNCVDIGSIAYFWTSEQVNIGSPMVRCFMADCFCDIIREIELAKTSALSVRCVKEMVKERPEFQYLDLYTYETNIFAYSSFVSLGSDMDHYKFCIATNAGMTEGLQCYDDVPTSYYLFTGLTPGTTYYVQVIGFNAIDSDTSTVESIRVNPVVPVVTTGTISDTTYYSANVINSNITFDGGESVTARGVCWSTSPNPTLSDSHTSDGTGTGSFTSSLTGLSANTTYYVRAYATNSVGTAYGDNVAFTSYAVITFMPEGATGGPAGSSSYVPGVPATLAPATHDGNWEFTGWNTKADGTGTNYTSSMTPSGIDTLYAQWRTWCTGTPRMWETGTGRVESIEDYNNNVYRVIQIGDQCWMKENLKATHYADGTQPSAISGAYFYTPGNSGTNVATYGYLYNWKAAMKGGVSSSANPSDVQGICPNGWHVPSDAELTQLTDYVKNVGEYKCQAILGNIAQALASTGKWTYDASGCVVGNDPSLNNKTGFSALSAGYYNNSASTSVDFNISANFISSTQHNDDNAYYRYLYYTHSTITAGYFAKAAGYSVRCVRGEITLNVTSNRTDTISRCGSMDTTVTYTATLNGAMASTYSWKVNGVDSSSVTGSTLTVRYTTAATNKVVCTAAGVSDTAVTVTRVNTVPTLGLCEDCGTRSIEVKTKTNVASIVWRNSSSDSVSNSMTALVQSASIPAGVYTATGKSSAGCTVSRTATLGNAVVHPCTVLHKRGNEQGSTATTIDSVKDHQDNWYKVVQIGSQCWLAENMRATTEPDSPTSIVQNPASGTSTSVPRAYQYNNSTTYSDKYGLLYNFPGAMNINDGRTSFTYPHRGVCPDGWHVPQESEWDTLVVAAGCTSAYDGGTGLGKLTGGCDWTSNSKATAPGNYSYSERNSSGFTALPAGGYGGSFGKAGDKAYFLSATLSSSNLDTYRSFGYDNESAHRDFSSRGNGMSVRCVRDVTGLTLGAVTKTDSTATTLNISTPYTATKPVIAAKVCAYTDSACTIPAGNCDTNATFASSPITGTITGLTSGAQYYVKVTATTAGGSESAVGGPFGTKYVTLNISSDRTDTIFRCGSLDTTVTYTATVIGDTPANYAWKVNGSDSSSVTGSTLTVHYTGAATNKVVCTAAGVSDTAVTVTRVGIVPTLGLCEDCGTRTIEVKTKTNVASIVWRNSSSDSVSNSMTALVQSASIPAGVYAATGKSSDGCTVSRTATLGNAVVHPCTVLHKRGNEQGSTATTIDSVKDHQDNWYKVVQIGSQCWLAENMRATTEPDSPTSIVQNPASGTSTSVPRAYQYSNSTTYSDKYGLLYNFPGAMNINDGRTSFTYPHRGVCPDGWHVPQESEWDTLVVAAGCTSAYDGGTGLGKLTGGCDWTSSSKATAPGNYSYSERNSSGFTALPAGGYGGSFGKAGDRAYFLSATLSSSNLDTYRSFGYGNESAHRDFSSRGNGMSVRCVRDVTGLTLGAVTKTDSTATTLNISTPYTATKPVIAAKVCAYTDSACTIPAGNCDTNATFASSPITGTITGLTANTQYYVKVTATTAGGSESAVGGPFATANPITDTITFMPNGGFGTMPQQQVTRGRNTQLNSNAFTHTGNWAFAGWNTEANGRGTRYANQADFISNGNDTLYAQWHTWCTGTAKSGETGTSRIDSVKDIDNNWYRVLQLGNYCFMRDNLKATRYANGEPMASGTATDAATAYYYYPNGNISNVADYGLLYNWTAAMDSSASTYAVPSEVQGACPDGWHLPSALEVDTIAISLIGETQYRCNADIFSVGKALSSTFGWSTSTVECAVGNTQSANNTSGTGAVPSGIYDGTYSLFGQNAYYWCATERNSNESYVGILLYNVYSGALSGLNKNVGASLRCIRNFPKDTITFISNGGTGTMDPQAVNRGITAAIKANTFIRPNYLFAGWNTDAAGLGTHYDDGANIRLYANDTLYAQWTRIKDTITFVANGGTGTMAKQAVPRDMATALNTITFTHSNWAFTGWNDACDGNGTAYADGANITTNGNVTLYANWHTWCTGTARGNEQGTSRIDSVKDHQNNWYKVVETGTGDNKQCWLAENMRCTTSPKGNLTAGGSISSYYEAYYYDYAAATQFSLRERGYLYNWAGALDTNGTSYITESFTGRQGICPAGWHLPNDDEWKTLEGAYLTEADGTTPITASTLNNAGHRGKGVGKFTIGCDWNGSHSSGTYPNNYAYADRNTSGFSAVPAGYYYDEDGFLDAGVYASFWSTTSKTIGSNDASNRDFYIDNEGVARHHSAKKFGYSVRCLRDVTGITLGAVTKTDSNTNTLNISTPYTATQAVTAATVCAYTDPACTTPAGTCATGVSYASSPITGTITGLTPGTQYYVKVTATTAGGTESAVGGPFATAEGITDTITFVANGGTGTMAKQVVTRGVATPLSTLGYSHTGNWAFTGWNDACDGNGTTYDDGANITTNGNVKLYANWHTWCTGTAYINESGTARIDSVKDHQDNWYKVVQIGTQCWLAENMRCSTSPNGHLTAGGSSTSTLLAYYYDYSTATQFTLRERGYLYNWAGALDTNATSNFSCQIAPRGICPAGWHLPTDLEWKILEKGYLTETDGTTPIKDSTLNSDGEKNRGKGNGKFTGGCDWNGSSSSGTFPNNYSYADRNISGFSALPAGLYFIDESIFYFAGAYASFWSATSDGGIKAWDRTIYRGYESVGRSNTSKKYGFSVRCVRDNSGLTLGAVTKTDSTATTLSISTPYTATQAVIAATVCAFTDATCITPAGTCDTNVSYASSPITGTITGLTPGTYYVKVTATTAGGSKSAVGGPFRTVYMITDTITFVANGGTGTMTKQVVMRGVATPLSTLGYSHTGNWAFTEWNDACDGDGNTYTDGANITTNGNVTLYANWHTWCTGTAGSSESGTARIDSVKDHQDNWYKVVQIGNQCWMKENMKTTKYYDGTNISLGSDTSTTTAYRYYPNNDANNVSTYGYLYNWKAVMHNSSSSSSNPSGVQGICPNGWHVPSDAEWTQLTDYVSSQSQYVCGGNSFYIAKALASTTGWNNSTNTCTVGNDPSTNNATGFSAVPAGYYYYSIFGNFGDYANFWSSTEDNSDRVYCRFLPYFNAFLGGNNATKKHGFSVRCVRDVVTLTVTSNRTDTISRCGSMDTTVTYTATIEGATASSYSWKVNGRDSTAVTGNTLTVRYTAAATNNVVCTAAGVSDTAVTVTQISKLLTLGLCETCIEGTITMKTGNCTSVTWVNNADPTKTGTVSSVSEGSVVLSVSSSAPAGVYTFTGTNSDGCTVSRTATLGNAVPHPCTVAFQRSNEAGSTATSVDSVKDHQNNWYKVVQIGSQCWLAENMRCSTSPKGNLTAGTERSDYIAYYFDYSSATQLSLRERGYLYNWPGALDTTGTEEITASFTCRRGICPEGWHLPTDEEWKTLEAGYLTEEDGTTPITAATLNSEDWRGKGAGKFTGGCDWKDTSETTAPGNYSYADRNMTGFFALPAGYWWGHFNFAYDYAFFWSATSKDVGIAYFRELNYGVGKMRRDWWPKNAGKSVRCVRDVTGLTLGAVTGTDSTGSTLSISTPYTTTQAVTAATVCAYTDAACTTLAGTCATGVSYESSPITGTITGLTPGASYYVKVTASTAGGTESAVGGPFRTKNVKLTISSNPSSASVSLCGQPSTTVTYTATLTGSTVSSYNWSVTGGTGSSTTNMITVTATDACTINVSCTAEGVSASKSTIVTSGGTVPKLALCETCSEGTITVKLSENASSIVWRNSSNDSVSNSMTGLVQSTTIPAGVYTATAKSSDGCTVSRTAALGKVTVHPCTVATKNSNEAGSTTTTIDSVKDHQDNWYRVVQIGSQCWLAENMRATTEPGSSTTIVENPALLWGSTSSPRAYHYSNSTTYSDKFGLIYNFAAAMNINDESETFTYPHRGICPQGWHIPQTSEWDTLAIAAGCTAAYNTGTGVGKLTSGCDWSTSTKTTAPGNYSYSDRNSSGFSALPGGYFAAYEGFIYVNARTDFWSSTPYGSSAACSRMLHYNDQFVTGGTSGHGARDNGLYVRCVRDNTTPVDGQPCPGAATLTDVDGNVYNTVQIGNQCWMKENLKTTKYADGTSISLGISTSTTTAYRYYPNNDASNVPTYGYLYNWKSVMRNSSSSDSNPSGVQGICPNGWHLPSNAEWTQLTDYVSSQSEYVCESTSTNIAKALASNTGWNSYTSTCAVGNDPSTNNATGFSAVPAGCYGGSYYLFGDGAYFWSSTEYGSYGAYSRGLGYGNAAVPSCGNEEYDGFSVRCLKD